MDEFRWIEVVTDTDEVKCARLNFGMEHKDLFLRVLDLLRDKLFTDNDLVLWRLFPPAYDSDLEANVEYHNLMHNELVNSRLVVIEKFAHLLEQEFVDIEELWSVIRCLNDVRLMFSAMLGIHSEADYEKLLNAPSDSDPFNREQLLFVMELFGVIVEEALSAVDQLEPDSPSS